jgi:RNA polymerase sigma factor (sigma-70 family)
MPEPMSNSESAPPSGFFPTTQWTQVIETMQKGDDQAASAALSEFCEQYRPAVYHFFCRHGCNHERAEDFTQEFFASRILRQWDHREGFVHAAQRIEGGKFRSFLCQVLWRFLQDAWKRERTARAGGSTPHVPLEELDFAVEDADPEAFKRFGQDFDRVFALEVIRKAAARSRHSRYLEAHLRGEMSQQEAAKALGLSENAFKQAYHRFRERLAHALWEEVSRLVGPDETEIRAEIEYLIGLSAE